MTGEFYLLNALWIGAALCLAGYLIRPLFKVLRAIVVMLIPFGLVVLFHKYLDIRDAIEHLHNKSDPPDPPDNVTKLK